MEITIQQEGDEVSRRNFKLKNGFYENSAYNDGGVPTHYIIVAWLEEAPTVSKEYMDKFYPAYNEGQYFIVLGDTNDEDPSVYESENSTHYLQELAIKLAEEKGLIPEYTILDIFKNSYSVTLYGGKNGEADGYKWN
jgi:hypothetical protein